jgi:hypothetical protein
LSRDKVKASGLPYFRSVLGVDIKKGVIYNERQISPP